LIKNATIYKISHVLFSFVVKGVVLLNQVWMVLISGMFWCTVDAGFFILINDYVVYNVGLSEYETAFGVTLLGKAV